MKFIRLTSVFLCCALLSFLLILPASAVDDDNYYSVPAVSDGSAPVTPASLGDLMLASAAGWDSNDKAILESIYKVIQCLLVKPSSIMAGSLFSRVIDISANTEAILNNLGGADGFAKESTLSSFADYWNTKFTVYGVTDSGSFADSWNSLFAKNSYSFPVAFDETTHLPTAWYQDSWYSVIGNIYGTLFNDYKTLNTGQWSFYHYVKRLTDVLANDDDLAMREDQKENVDQVKKDFITGQSGKTSLGKDDFGSLSSVGGTFKDTISLNGQSSLSDLTSGLADADTAGQGWFSQATKDSLDAVPGSGSSESTVSTFSDDGLTSVDVDSDPYHMQGFEDNYAWLWGDDDG